MTARSTPIKGVLTRNGQIIRAGIAHGLKPYTSNTSRRSRGLLITHIDRHKHNQFRFNRRTSFAPINFRWIHLHTWFHDPWHVVLPFTAGGTQVEIKSQTVRSAHKCDCGHRWLDDGGDYRWLVGLDLQEKVRWGWSSRLWSWISSALQIGHWR